jgi:hypothetical protein
MRRTLIYLSIFLIFTVLGVPPRTIGEPGAGPTESPFMHAIRTVLADEDAALRILEAERANAPDEKEALTILRRIAQRKQESEIAILRIQERRARELGNEEAALRIDEAIRRILDPQPIAPSPEALLEIEARRATAESHE